MSSIDRMDVPEPHVYDLDVLQDRKYSVVSANKGIPKFYGISDERCPKIYMVVGRRDATVYYVGQTDQAMKDRFKDGFRNDERYLYDWAIAPSQFRLLVWDLSSNGSGKALLESVEAELVFCVRVAQRAWPKNQTGISFRHIVDQSGQQPAPYIAMVLLQDFFHDYNVRQQLPPVLEEWQKTTIETIRKLVFPIGLGYTY